MTNSHEDELLTQKLQEARRLKQLSDEQKKQKRAKGELPHDDG